LLILYSAAFNGRPNGAQLSETGLFLQMLMHVAALDIDGTNVGMVSTPMYHIVAWLDLIPTWMMGGKVAIARRTDAEALCELIHTERVVTGRMHPPVAVRIAEYNADRRFDLSCFRSSLAIAGWAEMTGRGPEIGGTGQTEVAGPIVIAALGGQGSTPFSGRIAPIAEARIVAASGEEARPGEVGELYIRGPVAGLGYWNRPQLNAERLVDGWWRTNDLVRRDADGTISFVAPKLQMVKSGGENVYPAEVEAALHMHPAVARAAIIGTPDAVWSQIVTAIVALKPGQQAGAETLKAYLEERIARYKVPRVFHFVEDLPLAGSLPDYKALDVRFGGGNYPGQEKVA
jgi:acyl-CoA synthetase (AMP-forming)/AMP-acid ligase II